MASGFWEVDFNQRCIVGEYCQSNCGQGLGNLEDLSFKLWVNLSNHGINYGFESQQVSEHDPSRVNGLGEVR